MEASDFIAALVGARVEGLERAGHCWQFRFSGGRVLTVECAWRLCIGGRVALTGEDDGQWFGLGRPKDVLGEARQVLLGQAIEASSLSEESGDLRLRLSGGAILETWTNSSGYEAWQLNEA